MKRIEAQELLRKYRAGTLTEEEQAILDSWYNQQARSKPDISLSDDELESDLERISNGLPVVETPARRFASRPIINLSIAASVLLVLSVGISLYLNRGEKEKEQTTASTADIYGGGKKAVLTLADNREIVLDSVSAREIALTKGISVSQTASGRLKYVVDDRNLDLSTPVEYNTIATPAGSEYQVQLSDGTVVRLNALSSIRFPTTFRGGERRIEVTGEVYLEVARNETVPFRVMSGQQMVEVLGTAFNIDASNDDGMIKTTLVEGSVRIYNRGAKQSAVLKPGQQSVIASSHNDITIRKIDVEEAIAWKDGYFLFADDDLKSIMSEISHWYDVEVDYRGDVDLHEKFGGTISRTKSLSEVLRILELTGNVRFEIVGRRIVVMA